MDGDGLPSIGVAGEYEMLNVYGDPGDCNSSQLTPTTINEVDDLKNNNLNEEKVVAEGATSLAYLGPLASKSKVTQLESEDEFTAAADCTGNDLLELVTEQGGAPGYLCMNPCSGDASEVVSSRIQLLERPGWHASGYEGSERQAWGEVADMVAITPANGSSHSDSVSGRDLTAPLCVLCCLLVGLLLLFGPRRNHFLGGALRGCEPNAVGVKVTKIASTQVAIHTATCSLHHPCTPTAPDPRAMLIPSRSLHPFLCTLLPTSVPLRPISPYMPCMPSVPHLNL